jgi:aspartyl-tRNA(Asn)/glutamyl-tRNA(Gln) amidotransferase subunit C
VLVARCHRVVLSKFQSFAVQVLSLLTAFMIDREQVHKVAHLARLELTPEEEERFTTQLNDILGYFEQLSELDTESVPPTARAIDVSNVTRPDQLQPYGDRDSILESAPDREATAQGDFFKVPKIMNAD